jgi:hypothetical protein
MISVVPVESLTCSSLLRIRVTSSPFARMPRTASALTPLRDAPLSGEEE